MLPFCKSLGGARPAVESCTLTRRFIDKPAADLVTVRFQLHRNETDSRDSIVEPFWIYAPMVLLRYLLPAQTLRWRPSTSIASAFHLNDPTNALTVVERGRTPAVIA